MMRMPHEFGRMIFQVREHSSGVLPRKNGAIAEAGTGVGPPWLFAIGHVETTLAVLRPDTEAIRFRGLACAALTAAIHDKFLRERDDVFDLGAIGPTS